MQSGFAGLEDEQDSVRSSYLLVSNTNTPNPQKVTQHCRYGIKQEMSHDPAIYHYRKCRVRRQ